MRHLIALLAAPMLLSASLASAQETGSLSGTVLDVTGRPVVGATVRITGEAMPAERTMATSDRGTFGFLLLPGEYVADVEKTGVGKVSRRLVVEVARETRTDIVLGAITADPVSVTAPAQPDIDLKSTEVTFNYRRSVTQDLPLDRSYLGYLQLIPGVAEHQGFTPNGGASQRDNAFLVDSVHISNPFFGYLSTEINELDIAEFDVKRGALRPEFGRSTGFITNAVIKSGSNSFAGAYRFEAIPSSLIAESAKVVHSSIDRWTNAFGFGGPVVKSRLFFYASASILRSGTPGAANLFGPLPNRKEATNESFGKVTAHLGLHVIAGGVRNRPTTVDFAGIGVQDSPDVASNIRTTNRVANASYDWFVGNRTTVSVRYVHLIERTETTAVRDLGFLPPFEEDNVSALGHVVVGGISFGAAALKLNRQDYSADELKANVSRHFDMNGMTHQLKIGFGWNEGREDLTRRSNGWGDISYVIYGDQLRVRASTYPEQPSQHSTGRTYTLFAQDDISIGSRIAINAGVLTNRDDFEQTASGAAASSFPTFGFFDELQPRVGLTVQLRKGQGDKAYVNWGRYYGLDQISSARAVSGGRLYTIDTDFDAIYGRDCRAGRRAEYRREKRRGRSRPAADRRVCSRLRHAAWRSLDVRRLLPVAPQQSFHRGRSDRPAILELPISERSVRRAHLPHPDSQLEATVAGSVVSRRELRVEPPGRQLRSGLHGGFHRRAGLQHVVALRRRTGGVFERSRIGTACSARIGRMSTRFWRRGAPSPSIG